MCEAVCQGCSVCHACTKVTFIEKFYKSPTCYETTVNAATFQGRQLRATDTKTFINAVYKCSVKTITDSQYPIDTK